MSESNSTIRRVVGYCRVSTRDQVSIPEQKAWIEVTAQREGMTLLEVFVDHGVRGKEIEQRAGLQSLLSRVDREMYAGHPVDAVLAWAPDRFSRADSFRTGGVLGQLMDVGCWHVLTHTDGLLDLNNRTHRVLFNIGQDLQRDAFSVTLSQNVLRGMAARAREGKWTGGPRPYGYAVVGEPKQRRLVLGTEEEQAVVRYVYTTYLEEEISLAKLARRLNLRGVPPIRGKNWTRYGIWSMLTNPLYAGFKRWNSRHCGAHARLRKGEPVIDAEGEKARQLRRKRRDLKDLPTTYNDPDDLILVPNAFPALVSKDEFDAVQRKLESSRIINRGMREDRVWVLSGLMSCGHCGAGMWCASTSTNTGGRHYRYDRVTCSARHLNGLTACADSGCASHKAVLTRVADRLRDMLGGNQGRALIRDEINKQIGELARRADTERDQLQARLSRLDQDIAKAQRNYATAEEDLREDVADALRELKAGRETLRQQIAEVSNASMPRADLDRAARVLAVLDSFDERIHERPPEEVRGAIRALVEKITIFFARPPGKVRNRIHRVEIELHPSLSVLLCTDSHAQQPQQAKVVLIWCASGAHLLEVRPVPPV